MNSVGHAQYVRSCGKVSALTSQAAAPLTDSEGRPYLGTEKLEFIPSLCVSERYDTNVFFAPASPGLNRADFVTDVNPQVRVKRNGEYVGGYLDLGGFYETYVRNSNLNFFGTADTLYLSLDNSIKRLLPNATLNITDYVRYTPTPPGFSSVVAGTSPGAPINIQNVYAQGFLTYRANNLTNTANVSGGYHITPTTSLSASYSNSILRFGSSPIANGATLFNVTSQTGTLGGSTQVTPLDKLTVNYSHTISDYAPSNATSSSVQTTQYKIDVATLGWSRTVTPYLTAQVGGGPLVIEPGLITYTLNASLILNTPNNLATLSYARSATPAYGAAGAPIVGDIISVSAIQKLALQWELDEFIGYTHSSGSSGQAGTATATTYDSYFTGIDLYYWISKNWSTGLSFDYMNFNQKFGQATNHFDRYAVTLGVKATWN